MSEEGHEAASVLLREFETVFFAKGEALGSVHGYMGVSQETIEVVRFPFLELTRALDLIRPNGGSLLAESSALVAMGAKDFRAPVGLGGVHSSRCYVVLLKEGTRGFTQTVFGRAERITVGGMPAWRWSGMLGESGEEDPTPSVFYATQVTDRYLLVANGMEALQATASGLVSAPGGGTFRGLPDGTLLSAHEIWGYRKCLRRKAGDEGASGLSSVSKSVQAISFFVDAQQRTLVLRLYSPEAEPQPPLLKVKALPPSKPLSSGVWEIRLPYDKEASPADGMAAILALFGFGAYV